MKYCEHCGESIDENDKRCPHCGFVVADSSEQIVASDHREADELASHSSHHDSEREGQSRDEDEMAKRREREEKIEKRKEQIRTSLEKTGHGLGAFLRDYGHYFVDTLKNPTAEARAGRPYLGYVNIALLILFNVLPLITIVNRLNKIFQNTFTFFSVEVGGFADEIAGAINFKILIFFILAYFALFAMSYLLLRLTTHMSDPLHKWADRFGKWLTNGVVVGILATILALFIPLDYIRFVLFLVAVPILLFLFALSYTLYESDGRIKINKYYLLLIYHLVILLIIGLLFHFLLSNYFGNLFTELL